MLKRLSVFLLIMVLLAQTNPAGCSDEWSLDLSGCESRLIAVNVDPCHSPSHSTGDSAEHCECPCHVTFRAATTDEIAGPASLLVPMLEHVSYDLPGFACDIFRPPLTA